MKKTDYFQEGTDHNEVIFGVLCRIANPTLCPRNYKLQGADYSPPNRNHASIIGMKRWVG